MKNPVISQFYEARKQELIRLGVLDPTGKTVLNEHKMPKSIFTYHPQSYFARRIDKVKSLWRDIWFENECACLFGDPGVGKSSLAFQIAEHIADKGYGVLYVDFDNIEHQYESKGWRQPGNCLVETVTIDPNADFAEAIDYRKLLDSIEATFLDAETPVIVIDDISCLCPMRDCERTRRVIQRFRYWLRKYFVSILVIAHARKHPEGLPLGIQHLTGARQLAYGFDAIFTLNEVTSPTHSGTATHYVKQLKARNSTLAAPATAVLPFRFEYVDDPHMLFDSEEEYDESRLPTCFKPYYRFKATGNKATEREFINIPADATPEQVEQFVNFCDTRGWSVRQIAEHLHIGKSTVHRILARRYAALTTPSPSETSSVKNCPTVPSQEPVGTSHALSISPVGASEQKEDLFLDLQDFSRSDPQTPAGSPCCGSTAAPSESSDPISPAVDKPVRAEQNKDRGEVKRNHKVLGEIAKHELCEAQRVVPKALQLDSTPGNDAQSSISPVGAAQPKEDLFLDLQDFSRSDPQTPAGSPCCGSTAAPTESSDPTDDDYEDDYDDDDKPYDQPWDPCAYEEPVTRDTPPEGW